MLKQKMIVTRTSHVDCDDEKQPCREAVFDAELDEWVIYIKDLAHLKNFIRKNGGKVIIENTNGDDLKLEIYDGWRE